VEGRGRFYTNDQGRVVYVEAEYGGKGNWNQDLKNPVPNATYVVDDQHVFTTDDHGRTAEAHAEHLTLGDAERDPRTTSKVGGGRAGGYDGGHLIGKVFGGGSEEINLVKQLTEQNRGLGPHRGSSFYALERSLEEILGINRPPDVSWRVLPEYPGTSTTPNALSVEYEIDGIKVEKRYSNAKPSGTGVGQAANTATGQAG
jgi:hypothetical protein